MDRYAGSKVCYKKLLRAPYKLIALMVVIVIVTTSVSIFTLYTLGLEEQQKRLSESVKSRVAMINMIIDYQKTHNILTLTSDTVENEVLKQLALVHNNFAGFGDTGEYTLAKREGNTIHFLLHHRHNEVDRSHSITFDETLAEPMRRALSGQSGEVIAPDYRGERVVAAYEPIEQTGWGLVAKIDLSEIRAPYIQAGVYGVIGVAVLILVGSVMVSFFTQPLIKEIERRRKYNRMLFDASPLGLVLYDIERNLIDANPAFAAMLGYGMDQILYLNYRDITPEKYEKREEKQLNTFLETGVYGPYEKEYIHKDGSLFDVRIFERLITENGKRYIWSNVEDISEIKQNELALKEASLVFDHTHEGIIITDENANIRRVNKTFTDITGYTLEEVVGKNPKFLQSGNHEKAFYKFMWHTIHINGIWYGELGNRRKNGEYFATLQSISAVKGEEGKIAGYVSVFADISERKRNERQLAYLATHDALTSLPNRRHFYDNLQKAIQMAKRNKMKVALLYLDLDKFKKLNDTYGHKVGDTLLKEIAGRLTGCIREEDTAARLGGDEFAIILLEISNTHDALIVAQKIIQAVNVPVKIETATVNPSVSIGISLYPDHADSEDALIHCADQAMYAAKQTGENRCEFYAKRS